jgi:hypothetical protein
MNAFIAQNCPQVNLLLSTLPIIGAAAFVATRLSTKIACNIFIKQK